MGTIKRYKVKVKNEQKLNALIEKLEKQGLFKEEVSNDNSKNRHMSS